MNDALDPGKIPADLLGILVCPETHQPLHEAGAELVARLNARQGAGTLCTRGGSPVAEALHGALVREDRAVAYAIVDSIPIMLIEEAIPLDQLDS